MAIWKRHWHHIVQFQLNQPLLSLQKTTTTGTTPQNTKISGQKVQVQLYEHQNIVIKTQKSLVLMRYQGAGNLYLASNMNFHAMLQTCTSHHIINTKYQITKTKLLLEKMLLTHSGLLPVGGRMGSHGFNWEDRRSIGKLMGFGA